MKRKASRWLLSKTLEAKKQTDNKPWLGDKRQNNARPQRSCHTSPTRCPPKDRGPDLGPTEVLPTAWPQPGHSPVLNRPLENFNISKLPLNKLECVTSQGQDFWFLLGNFCGLPLGVKCYPSNTSLTANEASHPFSPQNRARCSKIQVMTQLRRTKRKLVKQESQMGFAWRQGTKAVRYGNFNNIILHDSKKKKQN